eukprot:8144927-Pyramimonas_sp.AAC.1
MKDMSSCGGHARKIYFLVLLVAMLLKTVWGQVNGYAGTHEANIFATHIQILVPRGSVFERGTLFVWPFQYQVIHG